MLTAALYSWCYGCFWQAYSSI